MPLEKEVPPFLEWLPAAGLTWILVAAALLLVSLAVGVLISIVRRGPRAGLGAVSGSLRAAAVDFACLSPRRVTALAWLAVKEAIRRKVVVSFAVFLVVLMLAGWFLNPGSEHPGRLYLSFVLTATSYLVLLLALFLSAFSLPADIRTKTLYTVVTKPVRASEIVLGRILGFTTVGTVLLAVMCLLSYLFVVRGLAHRHVLRAEDLRPAEEAVDPSAENVPLVGYTSHEHGHRHEVYIDSNGVGRTSREQGHTHDVTVDRSGGQVKYRIGPAKGTLVARVPIRGKLRFRSPEGLDKAKGINVGDEWAYRSYIQGGTPAAAIWTFENLHERDFKGDSLPLELTLGVFRTHKGVITRTVLGSLSVRNPKTGLTVETEIFESKEFVTQKLYIPKEITSFSNRQMISRKVETPSGLETTPPAEKLDYGLAKKEKYDLFKDLVADGKLEVWIQCLEPGQHFGAAQADLYLRARDASVPLNFVKGFYGIWLQMVVVIAYGVMFSTFLSGPVAMLATLGALVGGFFSDFMTQLSHHGVLGGGPFESFRRLITQTNMMSELAPGVTTNVMNMADSVAQPALRVTAALLPPFGDFSYANYVAYGFDIGPSLILIRTITAASFLLPLLVIGYLFLRNREVAA